MNTSEIEVLLEKFYKGNTSLQEEKILRNFFTDQDVPVHLKSHQLLFTYYRNEQELELNDRDFEHNLTSQLNNNQRFTLVTPVRPGRNRFMFITTVASSVLLLIGLFFTFQQDGFKMSSKLTGSPDPEIAYADASEALMLVSGNLNNGLRHVQHLNLVEQGMRNMQLFNKFYQYQSIIINPDEITDQSIKQK